MMNNRALLFFVVLLLAIVNVESRQLIKGHKKNVKHLMKEKVSSWSLQKAVGDECSSQDKLRDGHCADAGACEGDQLIAPTNVLASCEVGEICCADGGQVIGPLAGHTIDSFVQEAVWNMQNTFHVPMKVLTIGDMVLELAILFQTEHCATTGTTYETGTEISNGNHPAVPKNAFEQYKTNRAKFVDELGGTVVNSVDCVNNQFTTGDFGLVIALGLDPGVGDQNARSDLYLAAATGALQSLAQNGIFLVGQWGSTYLEWWNGEEGVVFRQKIVSLGYSELMNFPYVHEVKKGDSVQHHLTQAGDVASTSGKKYLKRFAKLDEHIIWVAFVKN